MSRRGAAAGGRPPSAARVCHVRQRPADARVRHPGGRRSCGLRPAGRCDRPPSTAWPGRREWLRRRGSRWPPAATRTRRAGRGHRRRSNPRRCRPAWRGAWRIGPGAATRYRRRLRRPTAPAVPRRHRPDPAPSHRPRAWPPVPARRHVPGSRPMPRRAAQTVRPRPRPAAKPPRDAAGRRRRTMPFAGSRPAGVSSKESSTPTSAGPDDWSATSMSRG
jgi:hypothetical protein